MGVKVPLPVLLAESTIVVESTRRSCMGPQSERSGDPVDRIGYCLSGGVEICCSASAAGCLRSIRSSRTSSRLRVKGNSRIASRDVVHGPGRREFLRLSAQHNETHPNLPQFLLEALLMRVELPLPTTPQPTHSNDHVVGRGS